jgi:CheY-like chemotaxis protein
MSSDNGLNNLSSADTIISTAAKSSTPTDANNKRILIVDDEEDIAWCFKIGLECAGFVVDIFNDPMKSLSVYKAGVYVLLLFDIRMPHAEKSEWFIRKPIGIEALIRKVESRSELQLKHNIDQTDI